MFPWDFSWGVCRSSMLAIFAPFRTHPTPGVCRFTVAPGAILAPCLAVRLSKFALTSPLFSLPLLVLRAHLTPRFFWQSVSMFPWGGPLHMTVSRVILMAPCRSPDFQLPSASVCLFASFPL